MSEEADFLSIDIPRYITPDKLKDLVLVPFGEGRVYMLAVKSEVGYGLLIRYLDSPKTPGVYRDKSGLVEEDLDGDILLSFAGEKDLGIFISMLSGIRDLIEKPNPPLGIHGADDLADDSELLF